MQNCPAEKHLFEIAPFDPTADAAPLAALHAACFDQPWDAASMRNLLCASGACLSGFCDCLAKKRAAQSLAAGLGRRRFLRVGDLDAGDAGDLARHIGIVAVVG